MCVKCAETKFITYVCVLKNILRNGVYRMLFLHKLIYYYFYIFHVFLYCLALCPLTYGSTTSGILLGIRAQAFAKLLLLLTFYKRLDYGH